jgi:hypothetical protein
VRANLGFRFASPQALCYRVLRTLVLDSVPFDLISDLVNPVNPVFSSSNREQQIAAELLRLILPGLGASETRRGGQFSNIR